MFNRYTFNISPQRQDTHLHTHTHKYDISSSRRRAHTHTQVHNTYIYTDINHDEEIQHTRVYNLKDQLIRGKN